MLGKSVIIVVALIGVVIIALIALPQTAQTPSNGSAGVSMMHEYKNKIVYTTKRDVDIDALRRDCADRNGTFEECGSPCAPDTEACTEVCAYTCVTSEPIY